MAGEQGLGTAKKLLNFTTVCFKLILLIAYSRLAVSRWTVKTLPGFPGNLPFELETGYVSVGESNDVQLFYYFVKSERSPKDDPLLLWLTGGPGCSTFSALAFEFGPLYFSNTEYDGSLPTLELNPDSWTKVSNIIFLDEPVGTGFSYSKSIQGYDTGDTKSAKYPYQFIKGWFIDHPEFIQNKLYICGDSYSGIIIPIIIQEIINGIEAGQNPFLNFKGYLIGNPVTDRHLEENMQVRFAHGMALISDELYKSMKKNCKGEYVNVDPRNIECTKDVEEFSKCTSKVNVLHILEPLCFFSASLNPKEIIGNRRSLRSSRESILSQPPLPPDGCRSHGYSLSYYWANNESVREALHIQKGTVEYWQRCNYFLPYKYDVQSSIKYHQNLSLKGYRSLIYSGDHDMSVSHLSTEAWIRLLNLSVVDDWHSWFLDGQIAGYARTYSNGMTYATVKGGGHTAPEYRPKESFAMFQRWISNNPL